MQLGRGAFLALTLIALISLSGSTARAQQAGGGQSQGVDVNKSDYMGAAPSSKLSRADRMQMMQEAGEASDPNDGTVTVNWPLAVVTVFGITFMAVAFVVRQRVMTAPPVPSTLGGRSAKSSPAKSTKPSKPQVAVTASPPPVRAVAAEPVVDKIPENQAEVDAMAYDERGASFFSSRPIPRSRLVNVVINLGGHEHRVAATEQEAEQVKAGKLPKIRAFTVGDRTEPWYAWEEYNPFESYWAALDGEWRPGGQRAIAIQIPLESCDPTLKGYYT